MSIPRQEQPPKLSNRIVRGRERLALGLILPREVPLSCNVRAPFPLRIMVIIPLFISLVPPSSANVAVWVLHMWLIDCGLRVGVLFRPATSHHCIHDRNAERIAGGAVATCLVTPITALVVPSNTSIGLHCV